MPSKFSQTLRPLYDFGTMTVVRYQYEVRARLSGIISGTIVFAIERFGIYMVVYQRGENRSRNRGAVPARWC